MRDPTAAGPARQAAVAVDRDHVLLGHRQPLVRIAPRSDQAFGAFESCLISRSAYGYALYQTATPRDLDAREGLI